MSRLDRHVNAVRTKLFLGTLLQSLAWALLAFAVVVLANILVDRFLAWRAPHWLALFWVGAGVSVAIAFAYTVWRRPTARQAAVAIDEKLGLKEKFSTALYVRPLDDPFAAAAVRDAEVTADKVSLQKRFPVRFPRLMYGTLAAIVLALLVGKFLGPHPLFADEDGPNKRQLVSAAKTGPAMQKPPTTIEIDNHPALNPAEKPNVGAARPPMPGDLQKHPTTAPAADRRSVRTAINDLRGRKDEARGVRDKAEQAREDAELSRGRGQRPEDVGSPAEAEKELAKGNLQPAADSIGRAVKQFEKMSPEEQAKAAEEMKQWEKKLGELAKDPQAQKQIAEKLKEMGATPQQLKQLAEAARAAAGGDPQAQQQVQQMANRIAQAANQQAGLTPNQQQANSRRVQELARQLQADANARQGAQNMSTAAGALARQMAAQAQANAKGGQRQGPGQQQPNGQTKPGDQDKSGPAVADSKAEMERQLREVQDAADQAGEGAGEVANAQPNGDGAPGQGKDANGKDQQANNGNAGQGPWDQGNPNRPGAGSGNAGVAAGGLRPPGSETPVAFRREHAVSQADEQGKIAAVQTVHALGEKGVSTAKEATVVAQAEKDSADEVDQVHITRTEQSVVRRYFDDLRKGKGDAQTFDSDKPQK